MKIKISSSSHNFTFWFPSLLIFNPVTATLGGRMILRKLGGDTKGIKLSPRACRKLFREINRLRSKHKNWHIVDINSSSGDRVLIKL